MKAAKLPPLTNPQFYLLEWICNHNGTPAREVRGKMLDHLLELGLVTQDGVAIHPTHKGHDVLKAYDR
jgi:hypothetical protein